MGSKYHKTAHYLGMGKEVTKKTLLKQKRAAGNESRIFQISSFSILKLKNFRIVSLAIIDSANKEKVKKSQYSK